MMKKYKTAFIYGFILLAVFSIFMLLGCGAKSEASAPVIKIDGDKINEGDNKAEISNYNLAENGLEGLKEMIEDTEGITQKYTVSYFNTELSKKGDIGGFTLTLNLYDSSSKYAGRASYQYNDSDKNLVYTKEIEENPQYPIEYNENSDFEYLDGEIKKLPLEKEIKKLSFDKYFLEFREGTKLEEGTPIIDGSSGEFKVMSLEDYRKCAGGSSDGHTGVIFTLYDGTSTAVGDNIIHYSCKAGDSETVQGDRNFKMQCDYYINDNKLKLTRDYGETWIDVNISQGNMKDTLNFYNNGLEIPENSYFISTDENVPMAVFYGVDPTLMISRDNGDTWEKSDLKVSFEKEVKKRIVGFISSDDGYAALGTDWSMGSGEERACFITHDGGKSWNTKKLPLEGTSSIVNGMSFCDGKNGAVSLRSDTSDEPHPKVFVTSDEADSWTEISLPWDSVTDNIEYISKIDSLTFENGEYTLKLGQGTYGKKKVLFKSSSLKDGWTFSEVKEENIHTTG